MKKPSKITDISSENAAFFAFISSLVALFWISYHTWFAEDFFITARVVENAVHGLGLRWNIDERVQVYTHPLWLFLHIALAPFFKNIYLTSVAANTLCISAALYLLWQVRSSVFGFLLSLLILCSLRAWVEYSVAGFENPLSHVLMLAFFWLAIRVKITNHTHWSLISIAIATALLNRMDVAVLFIPFCAYWGILALRNHCPLKCWTAALIGATPLIGWLLFSLFYYGFLLPNTYYAKLHTGISPLDYIWQSHYAFMDLLHNHANTAFFLILGAGLTLFACIKHIKNRTLLTHTTPLELLSLGAILYCLYFASIGGDHYSGRFFTLPALIFTLLIVEKCKRLYSNPIGKLCCILAVLSLVYAAEQLQSPKSMQPGKIEDARKMSERTLTLWNLNPQKHSWVKQGVAMHQASNMHLMQGRKEHPVVVRSNAGLAPFYAGPQVIIVDFLGITDPLIARTSVRNTTRGKWHSGHFWRAVPKGYVLARKGKGTQKMHSALAEYYQHLHTITSAPLFSTERLKTILNMQLGRYDHLLKEYEISLPWKK